MSPWEIIASGFWGSLAAGLCTGVGALPILFRSRWGENSRVIMLAVAAGIMLGATFFSLIMHDVSRRGPGLRCC